MTSKKKQEILQPVWGRFTSNADINYKYSGASIIIEAVPIGLILKWTDENYLNSLRLDPKWFKF